MKLHGLPRVEKRAQEASCCTWAVAMATVAKSLVVSMVTDAKTLSRNGGCSSVE